MVQLLIWTYLINAILLINHEIDSAYWKEWELFKIPGGITGFLLLHFPLLFVVLWGLILLVNGSTYGWIFSLLLCLGGIFAFTIHSYFLKKGRAEFNKPISKIILIGVLVVSLLQLAITIFIVS